MAQQTIKRELFQDITFLVNPKNICYSCPRINYFLEVEIWQQL